MVKHKTYKNRFSESRYCDWQMFFVQNKMKKFLLFPTATWYVELINTQVFNSYFFNIFILNPLMLHVFVSWPPYDWGLLKGIISSSETILSNMFPVAHICHLPPNHSGAGFLFNPYPYSLILWLKGHCLWVTMQCPAN